MNASPSRDIRPPAVAGMFYPAQPRALGRMVDEILAEARPAGGGAVPPKALIAPHAGYQYSGPIAATAFAPLAARKGLERVVLLGPSHRIAFEGLATTAARGFATPLGIVPVDRPSVERIERLPQVRRLERAHQAEHSLEVELPFLQQVLGNFTLVPVVTGDATDGEVAEVLEALWGGPETLVVISSDLSHYYDYETARTLDRHTAKAIEGFAPEAILNEHACGRIPIRGLLHHLGGERFEAVTLDLRNSGDTAGSRDRVVGYGAFALTPGGAASPKSPPNGSGDRP